MAYWIMKSEPSAYSILDLARDKRTAWEGVRNYQARNFMRDAMTIGDIVFFYHSACTEPGIVGLATVCSGAYPDKTALDPQSTYFDPKASKTNPRWYVVDLCYTRTLAHPVTLSSMRSHRRLKGLALLQKGSRLSVLPVSHTHAEYLLTRI